jgi:membrane protein
MHIPETIEDTTSGAGSAAAKADAPAPDDRRKPQHPGDLPARSWKYIAKRSINKFSSDGCTDLAGALTYYGVLSLFPAVLALVSILGLVGQAEQTSQLLLDTVAKVTDADMAKTLSEPVKQLSASRAAGWTLALGIVTALWSASGYVGAFGRSMNKIYGVDEGRPVWKLRPAQLLVTLAAVLMVAVMALLLLLTGPVARAVGDAVGVGEAAITVWNIAKWPVVVVLAMVLIAVLYYFTPNIRQPKFRWISVGAALALVALLLASFGFGIYIANFSKYEKTYGTITGLIVLLLWIWIMNLMLLLGAQVDAELERARELQAGIEAEKQVQLPPRDSVASLKKRNKELLLVAQGRKLRTDLAATDHTDSTLSEGKLLWWVAGIGTASLAALTLRKRKQSRADGVRHSAEEAAPRSR